MRVIVIDDSKDMRVLLIRAATILGYEVREAADGLEALDILAAGYLPDLALVDWDMPNMNGLEFVARARQDPKLTSMKILFVTAESEQKQVVKALANGADEYLMKPFPVQTLIDCVKQLLD